MSNFNPDGRNDSCTVPSVDKVKRGCGWASYGSSWQPRRWGIQTFGTVHGHDAYGIQVINRKRALLFFAGGEQRGNGLRGAGHVIPGFLFGIGNGRTNFSTSPAMAWPSTPPCCIRSSQPVSTSVSISTRLGRFVPNLSHARCSTVMARCSSADERIGARSSSNMPLAGSCRHGTGGVFKHESR